MRSHLKAIKQAKSERLECVLILEDDVSFVSDFKEKFNCVYSELPESWDMLYLNGSPPYAVRKHSDNLNKVWRLSGAFAYVVNSTFYDTLIAELSKEEKPCDGHYMDLQPKSNCYISRDKLVKHLDGYSVRAEKMVVYPHLR